MNNQTPYTHTRGWGVPAVTIVFGSVFVLGGVWLILSDLFKKVGTDAAATIVLLSGSCLVGGVLLMLVVFALVQSIREPRVQVQAPPSPSYEVLPATRQPPVLLPASNSLTRFQASSAQQAELRFRDQPTQYVPLAAVEMVLAMDVIKRPDKWPFANSAYTWIKRWLLANRYAEAEDGKAGTWLDRARARAVVQEWRKRSGET